MPTFKTSKDATMRDTIHVVRPAEIIELDGGVTLGPGTELLADQVPTGNEGKLYVKEQAPGVPDATYITAEDLGVLAP